MISPVKLFAGVSVSDTSLLLRLEPHLEREFGTIDYRSDRIGGNRILLSFEPLIFHDRFPEITMRTGRLMLEFAGAVRLHPGYIENAKVVHFDTADFRSDEFFSSVLQIHRNQLRTMCLLKRGKK